MIDKTEFKSERFISIEDEKAGSSITFDALIGTLVSYRANNQEVLYFNKDAEASGNPIDLGGIPLLFPICGALSNDTYKIGENSFNMPKHGFAFGIGWNAKVMQESDGGKIIASLAANQKTLSMYPFNFEVVVTYHLKGNELFIEQEYFNNAKETMPFYAGLHPYFEVGAKQRLLLDINADSYFDDSSGELIEKKYNGTIDFNNIVDFIFRLNKKGGYSYSFIDPEKKREIRIDTGKEFKHMVMWTADKQSEFLCLEPWMAEPDAMNTSEGVLHIEPGESLKTWIKISIISK